MLNIVQATVNQSQTLIGYVTKEKNHLEIYDSPKKHYSSNDNAACETEFYRAFIIELSTNDTKVHNLSIEKSKQVRVQFLYREKEQLGVDKFLMLIHHECK